MVKPIRMVNRFVMDKLGGGWCDSEKSKRTKSLSGKMRTTGGVLQDWGDDITSRLPPFPASHSSPHQQSFLNVTGDTCQSADRPRHCCQSDTLSHRRMGKEWEGDVELIFIDPSLENSGNLTGSCASFSLCLVFADVQDMFKFFRPS